MPTELTDEQREEYLRHPDQCPICKCYDIEGGSIDIEGHQTFQKMSCLNPECYAVWWDIYELAGVELDRHYG
ncbi:hypothetical protein LCGC14_2697970 [marine sediment metagenome]|uniref:Uncharacterized protein n=1 Tax=marine sediment metagenome TaxID=412755 RepID=A0A0F9BR18_9ZZZZ